MLKKVYIIEAKLSLEKNRQLTEYLESEKEYEKIKSYAQADYIITELKSPSRIMRNVRKSTCPVVHIAWLLESIRLKEQLDPQDYLIDVSDVKKQLEIDISARILARELPRQLTWDQVALRRLNKISFGKDSHLARNAGIKEQSRFSISYGSRDRSSKSVSKRLGLPRSRLVNLEKETQAVTLTNISASFNINYSDATPVEKLEKEGRLTRHTITQTQKNTLPILLDGGLRENQTYFSGVCNDPESKVPSNVRHMSPLKNNNDAFDNKAKGSYKTTLPNDVIVIRDDSYNEDKEINMHNEPIVIEDDSDNEAAKEADIYNDLNYEKDQDFSITASKELPTNEFVIRDVSFNVKVICSVEEISNNSTSFSFDNASGILGFNGSGISSVEFDASKYSLSAILSL